MSKLSPKTIVKSVKSARSVHKKGYPLRKVKESLVRKIIGFVEKVSFEQDDRKSVPLNEGISAQQ